MAEQRKHVVVVGAGYAGLLATVRLAGKTRDLGLEITLVNDSDTFVERVRLHQVAAGQTFRQRSIPAALDGTGVKFVQGEVTHIDATQRELVIQAAAGAGDAAHNSQRIAYDKLLYTAGSTIDRDRVPGVRAHAYVLTGAGERSVAALREALPALAAAHGRLLVCGGGATGIEAAAEFADAYPQLHVTLVTRSEFGIFAAAPRPGTAREQADGTTATLSYSGNEMPARYMRRSLERQGVTIRDHTLVRALEPGRAITSDGTTIPFDLCLWAGGFCAPALARESGLAVNERGQLLVDPFMRSISNANIYGAGDAAMPVAEPGAPVRMAAATAVIMGAHSADCLSAVLHGQSPRPLSFGYAGQGIALGRHNAIGFGKSGDDLPHGPYFTGRAGLAIRELFVKLLAALPSLEKRRPGFFWWPGQGRYAAAQRRATPARHANPA